MAAQDEKGEKGERKAEKFPSVTPTAQPGSGSGFDFSQELLQAASGLGVELPTLCLEEALERSDPESDSRRREVILPLISRSLSRHLGLDPSVPPPYDPIQLPDGRLKFEATPTAGLELSVAREGPYLLCSIGEWPQGCCMRTLKKRGNPGPMPEAEREELMRQRTECALKAAATAWGTGPMEVSLLNQREKSALFEVATPSGRGVVATLVARFPDDSERLIAFTVRAPRKADGKTGSPELIPRAA